MSEGRANVAVVRFLLDVSNTKATYINHTATTPFKAKPSVHDYVVKLCSVPCEDLVKIRRITLRCPTEEWCCGHFPFGLRLVKLHYALCLPGTWSKTRILVEMFDEREFYWCWGSLSLRTSRTAGSTAWRAWQNHPGQSTAIYT